MKVLGASYGDPYSTFTYSGVPYALFEELEKRQLMAGRVNIDLPRLSDAFGRSYIDIKRSLSHRRPKKNKFWRYLPRSIKVLSERYQSKAKSYDYDTVIQIGVGGLPAKDKTLLAHVEISIKTAANLIGFSDTYGFSQSKDTYLSAAISGEREFMNSCDVIWTNSEWTYQTLEHHGFPRNKFFIHPPVANIKDPGNVTHEWNNPHILFIGKDWRRKGGPQLVDAFIDLKKLYPHARLTVIGCTPNLPKLEGIISHAYLDKSRPDHLTIIKESFTNATVFCMPSSWESTGIVYMEAALYGLPIVMRSGQGREKIFPSTFTIHIDSSDSKELAIKLKEIHASPANLADMGKAARMYALDNYTWSSLADKIIPRIEQARLEKQQIAE